MLKFLWLSSLVCFVIGAPQDPLDRTRWNRYEKFGGNVEIERNIRIVGGSQAQPNQFQHAVALFLTLTTGDSFCGGSIINANFILTAAHCLDDLIYLEVNAGMTNIFRSNAQYRARVLLRDTRQHERYNRDLLNDDIGWIRLRTPITFSSSMRAVALPSRALAVNSNQNSNPFIIGWGRTSDGKFTTQLLSLCVMLLITIFFVTFNSKSKSLQHSSICSIASH
jgi:secreted trypsin-like serine protease